MIRYIYFLILIVSINVLAGQEADRDAMRQKIMLQYPFIEPAPGSQVSLQMLNGAIINGTIESISADTITIKTESGISVSHSTKNIHPFSKAFMFREDYEKALDFEVEKALQIQILQDQKKKEVDELSGRFFGVKLGEKVPEEFIIKNKPGSCVFLPSEDFRFPQRSDGEWIYIAQTDQQERIIKLYAILRGNIYNDVPEYFEIFKIYCDRYDLKSAPPTPEEIRKYEADQWNREAFQGNGGATNNLARRGGFQSAALGRSSGGGRMSSNPNYQQGARRSSASISQGRHRNSSGNGDGYKGFSGQQKFGDWINEQERQRADQQQATQSNNISDTNTYHPRHMGILSLDGLKNAGLMDCQSGDINIKFIYIKTAMRESLPSIDTTIIETIESDGTRVTKATTTEGFGEISQIDTYAIIITDLGLKQSQTEDLNKSLQKL